MVNLNEIQLKINDSFILRRFEKIDWKQIASLNMEQLKASSDWSVIEKNLCNILCCHLESEFKQSDLDPNLCKLFQLAQISIDYLLQIRQQILTELQNCQDKVKANNSALSDAIKAKEQAEKKLKDLKKNSKKATNQQNYYRCPACPKTFLNGEFLHGHWQRRHPEYVTIISSSTAPVPVNNSPVQPVTISSPIKFSAETSGVVHNEEISELKERLQLAEKQLQNEQQLLHVVMEKIDKSSVNLQEMLAQEAEKLRATLREEKIQPLVIPAEAPYSPQKSMQSSSAQTTPRMFQSTPPTPPERNNVILSPEVKIPPTPPERNNVILSPEVKIPTPSVRSVYKPETVNLIRQVNNKQEQVKSLPSTPSSPTASSSSEDEEPCVEVKKEKSVAAPTKVNRQILMDRFKKTIENALGQRMQMLGVDTHRKTLSSATFRQLSDKLKSNQSADYLRMRHRFEMQLKDRLKNSGKSPSKSCEKKLLSAAKPLLLTRGSINKKTPPVIEQHPVLVTTPVRAPVPTPRSRSQMAEPPTPLSLMARDGEAHSVPLQSSVKESTPTHVKVSEREPVDQILPKEKEKVPEEDDSFSFSSLDAILTELKKPNRYDSSAPTTLKSVQWRVPVETIEKPIHDSWDSP